MTGVWNNFAERWFFSSEIAHFNNWRDFSLMFHNDDSVSKENIWLGFFFILYTDTIEFFNNSCWLWLLLVCLDMNNVCDHLGRTC